MIRLLAVLLLFLFAPQSLAGISYSSSGAKTVFGSAANLDSLAGSSAKMTIAMWAVDIAPDNSNIYYSPYNWVVTSTNAVTTDAGAYFKFGVTVVSNQTVGLKLDISRMTSHLTEHRSYIAWTDTDGQVNELQLPNSGETNYAVNLTPGTPANGYHQFEVFYRGMGWNGVTTPPDQWGSSPTKPATAIDLVAVTIGASSSMAAPTIRPYVALFYGDSLSIGSNMDASFGSVDTAAISNNARRTWCSGVARGLNCEYGTIAFGGQGYQQGAQANVPNLLDSWDKYYSGQTRTPLTGVNYIFVQQGVNGSTSSANVATFLDALRATAGNLTKIVQIIHPLPDSVSKRSTIIAGFNATTPHPNTKLIDTGVVLVTPTVVTYRSNDSGPGGAHLTLEGNMQWAAIVLKALYDIFGVPGRTIIGGRVVVN